MLKKFTRVTVFNTVHTNVIDLKAALYVQKYDECHKAHYVVIERTGTGKYFTVTELREFLVGIQKDLNDQANQEVLRHTELITMIETLDSLAGYKIKNQQVDETK